MNLHKTLKLKDRMDNWSKLTYKDLLKRGLALFFFIGILYSIIHDKTVLAYFLKAETLIQLTFFTVVGGFVSSWVNYLLMKRNIRKKNEKQDIT